MRRYRKFNHGPYSFRHTWWACRSVPACACLWSPGPPCSRCGQAAPASCGPESTLRSCRLGLASVRGQAGQPSCAAFLAARAQACKHDRPARTALRLADTASQSQSSAPSDHIQHHCQQQQQQCPLRNNSSCGNNISAQINRLDVSRVLSWNDSCGCLFFARRIFLHTINIFPSERWSLVSRLGAVCRVTLTEYS